MADTSSGPSFASPPPTPEWDKLRSLGGDWEAFSRFLAGARDRFDLSTAEGRERAICDHFRLDHDLIAAERSRHARWLGAVVGITGSDFG